MAAIEVPDLLGKVRLDTSGLDAAVGDASRKGTLIGSAIGSAVGNLAAQGISRAMDAVGSFVTGSIAAASDLGESTSKVGVVFGGASDKVLEFASNAATALGQSEGQVLAAAGTFGNLLRAVGLSEDASAEFSTSMVQLATDLASFNNTDPTEALDALRAGLVGETEPLKRFGVNMNEATLKAKALELGLSDGKATLDSNAKAQAAYALIMEQTSLAQGDFARTSGGLANQQRIFSAQVDDLQARLGGLFLPAITKIVTALNTGLGPATDTISDGFGRLGDVVGPVVQQIADAAKGVFDVLFRGDFSGGIFGLTEDSPIVDLLFRVREAGESTAAMFQRLAPAVQATFSSVAAQIGPAAATISSTLLPAFGQVADVVLTRVVPTIQSLVASFVVNVLPVIQSVAGFILNSLYPALATIAAFIIGTVVPAVLRFAADIAARLQPIIAAASRFIVGTVVPGLSKLTKAFMDVWPSIQRVIVVVGTVIGFLGRMAAAVLGVVVPALLRFAGPVFGALFSAIATGIRLIGSIIDFLFRVPGAIGSGIDAFNRFNAAVRDKIGAVLDTVRALPGRITDAAGDMGRRLYSAGRDLLQGLIDGIKSKVEGAVRAVKDAVGKVIDGAKNLLGISSPSKVFAGIGSDTLEGMVVGLNRMGPAVQRAVEDNLYVPEAPDLAPSLAGVGAGVAAAVTGAGGAPPVQVRVSLANGMEWLREFVRVEVDGFAGDVAAGIEVGTVA